MFQDKFADKTNGLPFMIPRSEFNCVESLLVRVVVNSENILIDFVTGITNKPNKTKSIVDKSI